MNFPSPSSHTCILHLLQSYVLLFSKLRHVHVERMNHFLRESNRFCKSTQSDRDSFFFLSSLPSAISITFPSTSIFGTSVQEKQSSNQSVHPLIRLKRQPLSVILRIAHFEEVFVIFFALTHSLLISPLSSNPVMSQNQIISDDVIAKSPPNFDTIPEDVSLSIVEFIQSWEILEGNQEQKANGRK